MNIGKNTFYKRYNLAANGLIELHAQFKDVPIYNSTNGNFTLQGKANANRFILSGQAAPTPPQGSAELSTGTLNFYVSGTSLSSTVSLPTVSLYKIKDNNIPMSEGGFTLASTGDNAAVGDLPATPGQIKIYTTIIGNGIPYLTEDFSGKEVGDDVYTSMVGGNVFTKSQAYLDPQDEDVAKALFIGGTQSWLASGDLDDLTASQVLSRYFANADPNNPGGFRMNIKPKNKSKPEGLWKNKTDNRDGMEFYTIYPPFWRWDHIKSLVNYASSTVVPTPPSDEGGAEQEPTKNNTIFKELYKTPDNSNAAESGKEENSAWAISDMKISTQKSQTGASSFRMYHMWQFSKDNQASDKLWGAEGGANSQFACAWADCIPYPVAMDHTYSSDFNSAKLARESPMMNQVKPEINMSIAISQLDDNVRWHNRLSQSDTLSAPDSTILEAAQFMKFKGYCSGSVQQFAMNDYGWSGGVMSSADPQVPLADNADPRLGGAGYKTLLRNFTVTFSNYSPVKGESLDTFLDRGLDSFYSGTNNTIVGGFTISRTVNQSTDEEGYVGPKLTAQPLLTRPSHWIASGNSGAGWTSGHLSRGIPAFAMSGAAGTGNTANLFLNGAAHTGWSASGYEDGNPAQYYESSVELPMDDFFDVKIVFDTTASNGWDIASAGNFFTPTQGGRTSNAMMCKAYFIQPVTSGSTSNNGDASVLLDKVPSIPIYFPAISGSAKEWNWDENPERWPNIMTVWLTNYRFYSDDETNFSLGSSWTGATASSGLTTGAVQAGTGTDDDPYYDVYKNGYGLSGDFPIGGAGSGNGKIAEAYIDKISLNNFGAEIFDNSTGAGVFTMPISIKNNQVSTPMGDRTSGSMDPANERGDSLYKRVNPTYITFGFDDAATLPNTNSNQKYAWMMWNGFSQSNFIPNLPNDLGTLQAWKSMVSGAATNRFTNYYGGQCKQAGGLDYGLASPTAAALDANGYQTPACQQGINVSFGAATGDGSEVDYLHFQTGAQNVLSNQGLSQKGTSYASIKTTDWAKRENILVSSRIIDVPTIMEGSSVTHDTVTDIPLNSIVVTNPSIFDVGDGTNGPFYMIWVHGNTGTNAQVTGSAEVTDKRSANLSVKEITDALITFNEPLPTWVNDNNLPRLLAGPIKYWITMQAFNGPTNSAASAGSYQTYVSGTKGNDKAYDNVALLGTLSGSVTTPTVAMTGSTYNESRYFYNASLVATNGRSSTYGKKWILDPDPSGNLELESDFGYGAYDEEERTGAQLDIKTAYVDEVLSLDVKGLIDVSGIEPSDDFKLVLGLSSPMANHSVEMTNTDFTGDEASIFKPHFLWGFKDVVPVVTNLSVKPLFNVIEESGSLYDITNQDLRSLKFSWDEDADDTWYRMLMVDVSGNSIMNKYHNAKMVIKGNEIPDTPAAKPATVVYDYTTTPITSTTLTTTVGSKVRANIEGSQGYAIQLSSESTVAQGCISIPTATNTGWKDLDEWTLVCHITSFAASSGRDCYLVSHGDTDFNIYIEGTGDNAGRIVTKINGSDTVMMSKTKVRYDGQTPMSIIITYNKHNPNGTLLNMFINGTNEDDSTNTAVFTATDDTFLGTYSGGLEATAYDGLIEEVILYNKCYMVPQNASEYVFKADNIDQTSGDITGDAYDKVENSALTLTHSAKLFVYDYTNIRGTTVQEVGSSKEVAWRVTTP
tara:strand:+ start:3082 stop:8133 length:5052 start_codon:yes stop_codon:yes gene_type:complete